MSPDAITGLGLIALGMVLIFLIGWGNGKVSAKQSSWLGNFARIFIITLTYVFTAAPEIIAGTANVPARIIVGIIIGLVYIAGRESSTRKKSRG
jgi:hypothetical protein